MIGIPTTALIACAVIVLALGALLSAGESALLRFTWAAADDLIEESCRGATRVRRLAEHRTRVLGALSAARVVVDMLAAVLITLAASGLVRAWWQILALTLLANIILLGVVVGFPPHTYGRRSPVATLLALDDLLTWVDVLAAPQRRLVSRTRRPESASTDAETHEAVNKGLREMIGEIDEANTVEDKDREMARSVVELGQTLVREVMVPRTDMVTIDTHKSASVAMRLFIRSGYSRVSVTGEDADDVRGILHLKDVLRRLAAHPE